MEDMTTGMNFYLLVLACLAATGGVVVGAIKLWAFMASTCRLAFKPSKATNEDVQMFNGPFRDDPTLGRAFDAEVKRNTKSSKVPEPLKQAAQNLQGARSRDSSPAGSSRSQGSGGAGPSETPWRKYMYDDNYIYREVVGGFEWKKKNHKGHFKSSNGP